MTNHVSVPKLRKWNNRLLDWRKSFAQSVNISMILPTSNWKMINFKNNLLKIKNVKLLTDDANILEDNER